MYFGFFLVKQSLLHVLIKLGKTNGHSVLLYQSLWHSGPNHPGSSERHPFFWTPETVQGSEQLQYEIRVSWCFIGRYREIRDDFQLTFKNDRRALKFKCPHMMLSDFQYPTCLESNSRMASNVRMATTTPEPPIGSQLPLTTGLFSRGLQGFQASDGFPWAGKSTGRTWEIWWCNKFIS